MKKTALIIVLTLSVLLLDFALGYRKGSRRTADKTQIDTLVIYRTKSYSMPLEIEINPVGYIFASFPDSVLIHQSDTVIIALPREQKVYSGEEYTAWVSGYEPNLDSLKLSYRQTVYQAPSEAPEALKRNRLGVSAGMTYDSRAMAPLTVDYTYEARFFSAGMSVGYDPIVKGPVAGLRAGIKILSW